MAMNMKFMLPVATALLAALLLQPEKAYSQSAFEKRMAVITIEEHLSSINENLNMIRLMTLAQMTPEEKERLVLMIEEEKRQRDLLIQKLNEEAQKDYSKILQGN